MSILLERFEYIIICINNGSSTCHSFTFKRSDYTTTAARDVFLKSHGAHKLREQNNALKVVEMLSGELCNLCLIFLHGNFMPSLFRAKMCSGCQTKG